MDLRKITENAGALDERITVSRESLASDGMGGSVVTTTSLGTFYANVMVMSGKERDMANQTESPRNYRFIVRRSTATAAIRADDKITWRSKLMNIRFIADEGHRQRYLMIEAEAGVTA